MSMLLHMPWCPIDTEYLAGDIAILPFEPHAPIDGLDDVALGRINSIMAVYKDIEGKPIDRAAIVRYVSKSPIDNLSNDEIENAYELIALVCFCGLAKRKYFNTLGSYCNSDSCSLYVQKFDKADFTALNIRRMEGQTLSGWPIDLISITIPVHCHTIREVSFDNDLLKALIDHRAQLQKHEWGRLQNALSCFNQANTDSLNVRYQIEWVLLCSAFQHFLEAASKEKDVACRFTEAFLPSNEMPAKDSARLPKRQQNEDHPLRYEWMRKFYDIRGDFAHGKLNTQRPAVWNHFEHLVLAKIAFPLVVKSFLDKAGKYKLTVDDQAQIDSFEKLADTPDFLNSPPDQKGSLDSHWNRIVRACKISLTRRSNEFWR